MREVLQGDVLENALNTAAFLRKNKMNPQWSAANAWKVTYKSFTVCFIRLYGTADYHGVAKDSWYTKPFIGDYHEDALSDELKEIVWANARPCAYCGLCSLELGHAFGKNYDHICEQSIIFTNPDAKSIECVKALLELRRQNIKDGVAKKHKYIPLRDR